MLGRREGMRKHHHIHEIPYMKTFRSLRYDKNIRNISFEMKANKLNNCNK